MGVPAGIADWILGMGSQGTFFFFFWEFRSSSSKGAAWDKMRDKTPKDFPALDQLQDQIPKAAEIPREKKKIGG